MKKSALIVTGLVLLVVLAAFRSLAVPQEAGGRWEYQEVGLDGSAAQLDQHGANGWELVTVYIREEAPNPRYVFKRPAR